MPETELAPALTSFDENWERARGDPCPCCGQETLRFVGKTCPRCSRLVPRQVAVFLQRFGMPAREEGDEVMADLLGHTLSVTFVPDRSALYLSSPLAGDRRLFQGLARELEGWALAKGLSLAVGGRRQAP